MESCIRGGVVQFCGYVPTFQKDLLLPYSAMIWRYVLGILRVVWGYRGGHDKVSCEETLNLAVTKFFKADATDLFDTFLPLGARNRGVASQKAVIL